MSPVRVSTVRQVHSEDEHSEAFGDKVKWNAVWVSTVRGQMHSETEHSEYSENGMQDHLDAGGNNPSVDYTALGLAPSQFRPGLISH